MNIDAPEQKVNITLDGETFGVISQIAKKTKKPVSWVCYDQRLEDGEDACYVKFIRKMGDIDSRPRISAEEMKRRLDALQN